MYVDDDDQSTHNLEAAVWRKDQQGGRPFNQSCGWFCNCWQQKQNKFVAEIIKGSLAHNLKIF